MCSLRNGGVAQVIEQSRQHILPRLFLEVAYGHMLVGGPTCTDCEVLALLALRYILYLAALTPKAGKQGRYVTATVS
jgi:hypothetical protein